MEYGDEKIIEILNTYKKYTSGNVYEGIKVNGEMFYFHEFSFYVDQVKIMLPLRFIDVPKEVLKVKYPTVKCPDYAKCQRDYNIDISLTLIEERLTQDSIEDKLKEQMKILREIQPAYEVYEWDIEENGFEKIGWYDYKSYGMDRQLYTVNFILPCQEQMLLGKFCCSIHKAKQWKPVILQIIYSINNQDRNLKDWGDRFEY